MSKILKLLIILLLFLFFLYLFLPSPGFPAKLDNSIQSFEPADVETPLRRGYYTDLTRDEVMKHYLEEFNRSNFFNLPLLTYRLNYPPEEAQTLIRDQARSTFLEEIVHPFRESIFVNGFEPKNDKDIIQIDSKFWRQKVIVRYYPSNTLLRFAFAAASIGLAYIISKEWLMTIKSTKK